MFTKWIQSYRDLPLMINQVTSLADLGQHIHYHLLYWVFPIILVG